jgi:hypothetical protein
MALGLVYPLLHQLTRLTAHKYAVIWPKLLVASRFCLPLLVGLIPHRCTPVIAVQVAMAIAIGDAGRHKEGGAGRERQFGYCFRIIGSVVITITI